jgi:hypothetical protein
MQNQSHDKSGGCGNSKGKIVQDSTGHPAMSFDRVPLSQLPSRYGIARSALYTRLKDLQIEPFKEGKKAYVSASELELLSVAALPHPQRRHYPRIPQIQPDFARPISLKYSPRQSRTNHLPPARGIGSGSRSDHQASSSQPLVAACLTCDSSKRVTL